jgi:hypothetical protein
MRTIEILLERATSLDNLKTKIINQVQISNDNDLLNRIYSALNGTNLGSRIKKALEKGDNEVKRYVDNIASIIINTPGTVEEKISFANGLADGYIDIQKMVDGQRHHFEDLIISNRKNTPKAFIIRVFHALRDVGLNEAKGPGEFALAVLSPHIKIFGEGDLKIGNHKIEVKAGGGRLGTTGGSDAEKGGAGLQSNGNYQIIQDYFPDKLAPDTSLSPKGLNALVKNSQLSPAELKEFAQKLFGNIFKGKTWVDLTHLVNAVVNKDDIRKLFTHAAFQAYKGPENKSKFHGMMLINFDLQELRYFEDFEEMYASSYAPSFQIVSSNAAFGPRLILPSIDLAPEQIGKVDLPVKGTTGPEINARLADYVEMRARKAKQGRNKELISKAVAYLQTQWNSGVRITKANINDILYSKFPEFKIRKEKEEPIPLSKKPRVAQPATPPVYPDVTGQTGPGVNNAPPPPISESLKLKENALKQIDILLCLGSK